MGRCLTRVRAGGMRGCAGGGWRSRNSEAEQEGERERARSIASASASQLFLFLAFSRPPFFSSLLHFSKTSQWLSPSVPLACPRYVACGRRGGDGRAPQGAAAGGGGDENSRECNFALSFFLSEEIKKKKIERVTEKTFLGVLLHPPAVSPPRVHRQSSHVASRPLRANAPREGGD